MFKMQDNSKGKGSHCHKTYKFEVIGSSELSNHPVTSQMEIPYWRPMDKIHVI